MVIFILFHFIQTQHPTILKKIDHIDNAANKNTTKRCNDGSLKRNAGSSLKLSDKNNQIQQPVLEDFLNNKKLTSQSKNFYLSNIQYIIYILYIVVS